MKLFQFTIVPLVALSASFFYTTGCARAVMVISETFEYTGTDQTFIIPDGVTNVTFEILGARGGTGSGGSGTRGGYGHFITGGLMITTGNNNLTFRVGGAGGTGMSINQGGFGGGGNSNTNGKGSGGGGGGLSTILLGIDNYQIVSGGGGGGGGVASASISTNGIGGNGGDFAGGGGNGGSSGGSGGDSGFGSGSFSGGTGGVASSTGSAGSLGSGGTGGAELTSGGGGGGGYWGGGGGGGGNASGGGGAGSAFLHAANTSNQIVKTATDADYTATGQTGGNGRIIISYETVPEPSCSVLLILSGFGLLALRRR